MLIPIGFMKSSKRISPGWIGGSSFVFAMAHLNQYSLVIVHDLHLVGITVSPHETDSPPGVNPDAVLPPSVALQRLQPVAWRNPQVPQGPCVMKVQQLPACDPLEGSVARHVTIGKQCLRLLAAEREDHRRQSMTRPVIRQAIVSSG